MGALLCCQTRKEGVLLQLDQGSMRIPRPSSTAQLQLMGDLAIRKEEEEEEEKLWGNTGDDDCDDSKITWNNTGRAVCVADPLAFQPAPPTLNQLCAQCSSGAACFKVRRVLTRKKHFDFDNNPLNKQWFATRGPYLNPALKKQLRKLVTVYQQQSEALLHETVLASLGRSVEFEGYLSTWCQEYMQPGREI